MAAQFVDDIGRARDALHTLDAGLPREDWVRAAMAAQAAGLDADDFIAWSRGASNFRSEADCRSVWRSIKPGRGVGAATLFGMARAAGWSDSPQSSGTAPVRIALSRPNPTAEREDAPSAPWFDAEGVWASAEPATAQHAYIERKLGLPDGLRVYRGPLRVAGQSLDGALLVPAFDSEGVLSTWQAIPAEAGARKLNAPGRAVAGTFTVGGALRDGEPAYLCEGVGAAWSAHQATGKPAVVAFGAGRMEAVARSLRERFPAARLVLVADVGKESDCQRIASIVGGLWVTPPGDLGVNGDANDLHQRDGLQAVADLLAGAKPAATGSTPAGCRFPVLTADDLERLTPMRWRVRGVLPEQGLAVIYGPPGSGKSFVLLDLLGAVAEGRPWFGHRTTACPVMLVCLEGEHGVAQRVAAYRAKHGRVPVALRFVAAPLSLLDGEDVRALAEAIRAAGGAGGIVAIDTLNRASVGADENDSRDMGRVIAGAKALQAALGGLVLPAHHTGKDATRGLRGHSSLLAAVDASIELSRDGDRREWRLAKSKDSTDGEGRPFRLQVVELGEDADGEPVTSCVVEPETGTTAGNRPAQPQGANQRVAWDVLGGLLRAAGDVRPEGAPAGLPNGRPTVRLEAALDAIAPRLVVEERRKRERATIAVRGLCATGLLCHDDGWLWCA